MNRSRTETAGSQLEHYTALEYILLGDLRDLLEEPPTEETSKWLSAVLDALLQTLPREMRLSEEGGYLSEVLEEFPSWGNHVDQLQNEKQLLFAKLRELSRRIQRQTNFSAVARELRGDLHDWMNHLIAHHRHERRLVQMAFSVDIGGGD